MVGWVKVRQVGKGTEVMGPLRLDCQRRALVRQVRMGVPRCVTHWQVRLALQGSLTRGLGLVRQDIHPRDGSTV